MATGQESVEGAADNLRKKLAFAVKSIHWSYAIFWSISSKQPGVLEWGDGYYNGDIKTRKTVQAGELEADHQLGLQRTKQLRELFESLAAAETNPQARRPSAALSPEDLSDTEWYFLVCMSFVFNIGQGLPGRTLANNRMIWLCNAHYADSKVFSRSLLAKSASIQTVVCFPYLGGVVELGITEKIMEDQKIIQHIKASFSETPYRNALKISNYASETCTNLDHDIVDDTHFDPLVEYNSSNGGVVPNQQQAEESFIVEGINPANFQVQSWQFLDEEEVSNCVCENNTMSSSDCISQTLASPEKMVSFSNEEKANDDIHYKSVLSILFKGTRDLILGPKSRSCNIESSFVSWKKAGFYSRVASQVVLKKVIFEVAKMHGGCLIESGKDDDEGRRDKLWKPEADEIDASNGSLERMRREKINQRFSVLGSLVPSSGKADKVSVLDGTIEYLKELERRIEELESTKQAGEREARTYENNGDEEIATSKKPLVNKRKASDLDVIDIENQAIFKKDSSTESISVSITEKKVLIEVLCPWREDLLLEIMDAMSHLHLDSHSVQSSIVDGVLSLSIASKLTGCTSASAGGIRQALQRVIGKC